MLPPLAGSPLSSLRMAALRPSPTSVPRSLSVPTSSVMPEASFSPLPPHSALFSRPPALRAVENQRPPKRGLSARGGVLQAAAPPAWHGARSSLGPSPPRLPGQIWKCSCWAAPCGGATSGPGARGHRRPGWRAPAATYWHPRVRSEKGRLQRKPHK